jgi:hypothetical protein
MRYYSYTCYCLCKQYMWRGALRRCYVTTRKMTIYHDCHFRLLLKTILLLRFWSVSWYINKLFFWFWGPLYCHKLGQIMVDGRPVCGRCRFFDFASECDLFRLWARDVSVSTRLFFHSHDPVHVARCSCLWSGPWVPDVSLSVWLSVPHDCWLFY